MKNWKEIANHFETIESVTILSDSKTLRVNGYTNDTEFMNGFDSIDITYNHKKVTSNVAAKLSYLI